MTATLARRPGGNASTGTPIPLADRRAIPWFVALIAVFPLAWGLGLVPVLWSGIAVPMGLWLLRQPRLLVPKGSTLWAVFLTAMALSALQVGSFGRLGTWGLRASWYVGATVCLLYVLNHPSSRTVVTAVRCLIGFWVIAAIGGWLGVLAPQVRWVGPVAALLPGPFLTNGLVADLTSPVLAELQTVGGAVSLARPAAPFAYTNSWGSTIALLTPFLFIAFSDRRIGLPRWLTVGMLVAALPPFVLALNRGSWLTLGAGLLYGAFSLPSGSRARAMRWIIALAAVAVTAALWTGALTQVISNVETRSTDSDETRSGLYQEALDGALESPLLGYGAPRPSELNPDGPPVGTHGQLWMVLYSHGFLAAACFAGFFGLTFLMTRPTTPVLRWSRVALLIGLLQLPIYGHLPQQLFVLMATVAILQRAMVEGSGDRGSATVGP